MGILNKKQDDFVANVTRTAVGEFIIRANGIKVPVSSISSSDLEQTPEAVASMMIYGYCTTKYSDPSTTDLQAMEKLLRDRGYADGEVHLLLEKSGVSLFKLINESMQYTDPENAYAFSDNELTYFAKNLYEKSPIFRDVILR